MSTEVIDRSPARKSGVFAIGTGIFAALALAVSGVAAGLSVFGVVAIGIGLYGGSRATVTLGAVGQFCGVLLAGLVGTAPELLLVSTAATVVAWDVATFAIGLGEELGRAAETRRLELVRAGASASVAAVAAGFGVLVYRLVGGGPALASVVLLCGAVVLAVALRP